MSITLGTMDVGVSFVGDASALQSATAQAQGGLEKFGATSAKTMRQVADDTAQANAAMQRLATGLKGAVVGGSLAVGLVKLKNSITEMSAAIIDAQVQLDKWNNGFKFGAGSMAAGTREMAFVREEAQRLGLELSGSASQYMKLVAASRGTTMEGEKTRQVFTAIAEAATVMGMSSEQSERAFMAVTQMMSKGKVQAEELRGQLGEHLPGAFAIAARAMGVTEMELNKLMETGNVMSADFLPKFGAQLRKELAGSVEDATKSMQASLNRYETAWLTFKQNVAQSGVSDFIGGQINILSDALANISTRMEDARGAGGGFWAQTAAGAAGVAQFINPLNAFSYSAQSLDMRLKEAQESLVTLQERAKTSPESPFFRVEIAQTQLLIKELQRAMQAKAMLDVAPGPTGSVASGDSALARANQADYEKRLAAYKGLMASMASPQEKFNTELAKQKALLGDLFTPDVEARLRAHYIKPTKEAKEQTDEFAKVLESLQEKTSGLSTDYSENLATLFKGLGDGKFGKGEEGVAKYRAAVESLIKLQPFFKDGLKLEAQAMDDARKAAAAYAADLDRVAMADADVATLASNYADAVDERIRAAEFEYSLMGQTSTARQVALRQYEIELELQKQILAIKKEMASEDEQAKAIAAVTAAANRAKSNAAAEVVNAEFQRVSEQIEQSLTDALMRGFESGKSFAMVLRDTVANMFKTLVLRPIISAVVNPVAGAITGSLGLAGAANAGQGGNLLGTASNLSSAWDVINNGVSNAVTAGFDKLATSGFGQKIGLSDSIDFGTGYEQVATNSTGATLGQYAGMAGNALAGYGLQKAISGGYKTGESGLVDAITVAASAYFGPIAGVAAGVFNRAFGRKLADQGLQGQFGGEAGFTGENYQFLKGGWFRSDKTKTSALDADMQSGLADQFKAIQVQTALMATVLGDTGQSVADFTSSIKLSFNGLTEAQIGEKLAETFTNIANDLAKTVLGDSDFAKKGEEASQTLQRLANSLTTVNGTFDVLGFSLQAVSLAGADAASDFIDLIGGLDAFKAATAGYYANFYTEAERQGKATEQLTTQLAALGQALPTTRDGFRALVESAEAAGNTTLLAGLLALQDEFSALVPAAEAASQAITQTAKAVADAAAKAATEARSAALAQLDASVQRERTLWEQQATAAASLRDEVRGIFDTLATSISELRAEAIGPALSAAQGNQFIAQALAGVNAGAGLPDGTDLASAISAARGGLGLQNFTSTAEQQFATLKLAGELAVLQDAAGEQLSTAERQLAAASDQIEQLDQTLAYWRTQLDDNKTAIDATLSVGAAVDKLRALMFPERSAAAAAAATVSGGVPVGTLGASFGAGTSGAAAASSSAAAAAVLDPTRIRHGTPYERSLLPDSALASFGAGLGWAQSDALGRHRTELEDTLISEAIRYRDMGGMDMFSGYFKDHPSEYDSVASVLRAAGIPGFSQGINLVPYDMTARIHKGEAVVPAAFNPFNPAAPQAGSAEVVAELRALRAETVTLRAQVADMALHTQRTANATNGQPERPMLVETV